MSNEKPTDTSLFDMFVSQLAYTDDWRPTDYTKTHTTDSTSIIVMADLHIPKHDIAFTARTLEFAMKSKIKTCLLLGDVMDMEEFSFFGIDDHTSSFKRNCGYTGDFIRFLAAIFDEIIWSKGNHEERLSRSNKNHIDMDLLANMCGLTDLVGSGQLVIVEHTMLYGSVGNWAYVHPAGFSRTPGKTPSDIASVLRRNVITAHEHAFAMVRNNTDEYWCISTGGMFDSRYHKYIQHNVKGYNPWVRGFSTVIDGKPHLYHYTDIMS